MRWALGLGEQVQSVFHKALECGLTLWDTAAVYGEGNSKTAMQDMLNGSKERLHIDAIDVYWIHNPMDVEKWTPDLIPLIKSGQIKSIGVSNHSLAEIKRANEILKAADLKISAVQNHFSLLHRSSERAGILDYCRENDITFYAYMVLEQGTLTGRYNKEQPFPAGTGRGDSYNSHWTELEALVSGLKRIGEKYKASPGQIATAWAIAKGTLPIIGVTKVKHVDEAAEALQIKLTVEEVRRLEKLGEDTGVHTLREWEKEM